MSEKITISVELEIEGQKISSKIDYETYSDMKKFHSADTIEEVIKVLRSELERGV